MHSYCVPDKDERLKRPVPLAGLQKALEKIWLAYFSWAPKLHKQDYTGKQFGIKY